jgi:hypothetical protein
MLLVLFCLHRECAGAISCLDRRLTPNSHHGIASRRSWQIANIPPPRPKLTTSGSEQQSTATLAGLISTRRDNHTKRHRSTTQSAGRWLLIRVVHLTPLDHAFGFPQRFESYLQAQAYPARTKDGTPHSPTQRHYH